MQESTSNPLDWDERQMHNGKYAVPPPPDGGLWDQLQEQAKAKQQLQLIAKYEKSKQLVGKTDSVCSHDSRTITVPKDSKSKLSWAGMETDQAE